MNEQEPKLRPTEIDGIQEYDNRLPRWWLLLFYGTILFAPLYMGYVHFTDGNTLLDKLAEDRQKTEEKTSTVSSLDSGGDASLSDELASADLIAEGKELYTVNCIACHRADGGGSVGPNLTDKFWLNGGSDEEILKSIGEGIPAKGMIAWNPILGPKKVKALTAYVKSLVGTNPNDPKEPQGEEF